MFLLDADHCVGQHKCNSLSFYVEDESEQRPMGLHKPLALEGLHHSWIHIWCMLKSISTLTSFLLFIQLSFSTPSLFWTFVSSCGKKLGVVGIAFGTLPWRPGYQENEQCWYWRSTLSTWASHPFWFLSTNLFYIHIFIFVMYLCIYVHPYILLSSSKRGNVLFWCRCLFCINYNSVCSFSSDSGK